MMNIKKSGNNSKNAQFKLFALLLVASALGSIALIIFITITSSSSFSSSSPGGHRRALINSKDESDEPSRRQRRSWFSSTPTNGRCKRLLDQYQSIEQDYGNPENRGLFLARPSLLRPRELCELRERKNNGSENEDLLVTRISEILFPHLRISSTVHIYENVMLSSFTGDILPIPVAECEGGRNKNHQRIAFRSSKAVPDWAKKTEEDKFYLHPSEEEGGTNNMTRNRVTAQRYFKTARSAIAVQDEYFKRKNLSSPTKLTVIRIHRFDVENCYEGMHIYLNLYLLLVEILRVEDPSTEIQFVFLDNLGSGASDDEVWHSFTLNKNLPIYSYRGRDGNEMRRRGDDDAKNLFTMMNHDDDVDNNNNRTKSSRPSPIFVSRLIENLNAGNSILRTSMQTIRAEEKGKSCPIHHLHAHKAVRWMKHNLQKLGWINVNNNNRINNNKKKINVIWSSRTIHLRDRRHFIPTRMIYDEANFVLALRDALGPDVHLRVVDFARLSRSEAIAAVRDCQVMIAFHGAGEVWSLFMEESNAALIEIFGHDRTRSLNTHYEIIAHLKDLNYVSLSEDGEDYYDSLHKSEELIMKKKMEKKKNARESRRKLAMEEMKRHGINIENENDVVIALDDDDNNDADSSQNKNNNHTISKPICALEPMMEWWNPISVLRETNYKDSNETGMDYIKRLFPDEKRFWEIKPGDLIYGTRLGVDWRKFKLVERIREKFFGLPWKDGFRPRRREEEKCV